MTKADKKTDQQLYNLYVDTVKDLKKALLVDYQRYEELSSTEQLKLSRMTSLLEQLDKSTKELKQGLKTEINSHLESTGKIAYNELFYEYESKNTAINFTMLKSEELKTIIETPVANYKLSERLNDGVAERLKSNIKSELTRVFLQGYSYKETAARLAELGYSSYRRALNITRTEAGRVQAIARQKSQLEAMKLGVEFEKEWISTLDNRTRSDHAKLDGQRVKPDEDFEVSGLKAKQPHMFGIAAEDCNCRCRTVSRLKNDKNTRLRRDNETGEIVQVKNYHEWVKAIDRRQFSVSNNTDYLKADKLTTPQKGKRQVIRGEGVSFSGRKVLNSKHNLYVSDNLGSARKSFSYYEKQITEVMSKINVPKGSDPPRFVLYNAEKDIGRKHNFGAYDPQINTVFIDATKPNQKAIIKRLQTTNKKWTKSGQSGKFFSVDDNPESPLAHELGHYKHYMHVTHHAKTNNISYAESKQRFNTKLLEFIHSKEYNIAEDISGYAERHLRSKVGLLNSTNEIISEANALDILKSDVRAGRIIKFLESEEW